MKENMTKLTSPMPPPPNYLIMLPILNGNVCNELIKGMQLAKIISSKLPAKCTSTSIP